MFRWFCGAINPGGRLRGELVIYQNWLTIDLAFYGLGDAAAIATGQGDVAERSDHTLARLPLRVPISFDELKKWSALDLFGAEKHTRKIRGAKRSRQLQNLALGTTKRLFREIINELRRFLAKKSPI